MTAYRSAVPRPGLYLLPRTVACLMIIAMHAPVPGAVASSNGLFLATLTYLTAPGIGLFFILSGALLLPVQEETSVFLRKRLGKVVWPTVFWTLFYLLAEYWMNGEQLTLRKFASIPFSTQGHGILWFMYTLIGLYLLAPIISRWLERASKKEVGFYLTLGAIAMCYPILTLFLEIDESVTGVLYYFSGYLFYFLLGYFLRKYPESVKWSWLIPLFIISLLAPIICEQAEVQVDFYSLFWYLSIFVVIQCVFWYKLVTQFGERVFKGEREQRFFEQFSNLSFGIYLVHIFIMRYLLWRSGILDGIGNYYLQTFLSFAITAVASFVVIWAISFVPKSQYVIGYSRKRL